MLHIHCIVVGKLKEPYWRAAEAEYRKRLRPFVKLDIHELKEVSFTEKDPPARVKATEATAIFGVLQKITDGGREGIIAFEEKGRMLTSPAFAREIAARAQGRGRVVCILGGPLGLDPSVAAAAETVLSLSALTFTHQLARVILLEQLYRSSMINAGRRYHY